MMTQKGYCFRSITCKKKFENNLGNFTLLHVSQLNPKASCGEWGWLIQGTAYKQCVFAQQLMINHSEGWLKSLSLQSCSNLVSVS